MFCRVTFKRVIRKKSTEEFSCIPYIIGLFNCLLFTWYGLPVVSYKWENFPLVTVNGVGIVLELSYVLIYFWYSSAKGKVSYMTHDNMLCTLLLKSLIIYVCKMLHLQRCFWIKNKKHHLHDWFARKFSWFSTL